MALMAIWLSVTVTWRVSDTWKEPGSAKRHVYYIATVILHTCYQYQGLGRCCP